jgi:catechol 2,3-dioxygenase-like lactoylglutathione lyase family enzyme
MTQRIGYIALIVRDYDDAIAWFTSALQFTVVENTRLSDSKRWVLVAPPGGQSPCLLLARAVTPEQESRIGNQTGGRVFLFLHTDDFGRGHGPRGAPGLGRDVEDDPPDGRRQSHQRAG